MSFRQEKPSESIPVQHILCSHLCTMASSPKSLSSVTSARPSLCVLARISPSPRYSSQCPDHTTSCPADRRSLAATAPSAYVRKDFHAPVSGKSGSTLSCPTSLNVFRFKPRVPFENRFRAVSGGQHTEDMFNRKPPPSYDRFPAEYLGVTVIRAKIFSSSIASLRNRGSHYGFKLAGCSDLGKSFGQDPHLFHGASAPSVFCFLRDRDIQNNCGLHATTYTPDLPGVESSLILPKACDWLRAPIGWPLASLPVFPQV